MLPFARNLPTPRHQIRPPIQIGIGQFGAIQQNIRAITSPINTSGAASNAAYASGNDPTDPLVPAQTSSMPTPQPLPPIDYQYRRHHQTIGLTPLGWGFVAISAFAIYKTFFSRAG